jgi:Zn-finger nucleic acid-binding protein
MEARAVGGYEIARCPGCRAAAMQDLALVGLLSPDDGGAERLLIAAELESIGEGDAVAGCPMCGHDTVRLGLLRGLWIGRCGRCATVTLPAGGLEELRWKVRDERRAELAAVLDEWAEEAPRTGDALLALLLDAASAAVRWWRHVQGRRARRRIAAARGAVAGAPPADGDEGPV